MDCRTCQPSLLDLAYGELAPELASVVRGHVESCQSCGAAFRALREGIDGAEQLAWLEPPPSLHVNALAYAQQYASERIQAAAAANVSAKPRATFLQSVFDFIGRLASGRQFAMATVMVLVAVVGVWVIPELQPLPAGQGVTVVSPDPAGEAAPSGGLAPAEPLDLTVDARSRRIRSREELEAAQLSKPAPEPGAATAPSAESYAEARKDEQPAAPPAAPAADGLDSPALEYEYAAKLARQAPAEEAKGNAATSGSVTRATPKRMAATEAFPNSELLALDSAQGGSRERSAPSPARSAPAQAARSAPVDDLLDGALRSSSKASSGATNTRADSTVPSLERARITRRAQGCAAALPAYEQAVDEYSRSQPQSSVLGTALLELAECQYQLGRESSARATLKRAEQVAPVAVRARAMLEGESDAQRAKPAAPAAAEPSRE